MLNKKMATSQNVNHIFKSYIPGTVKLWESPGSAGGLLFLKLKKQQIQPAAVFFARMKKRLASSRRSVIIQLCCAVTLAVHER
jgi:hypothetical protein